MAHPLLATFAVMTLLMAAMPDASARTLARDELEQIASQQINLALQKQQEDALSLLEVQVNQEGTVPEGAVVWQMDIQERKLHVGKQTLRLTALINGRNAGDFQVLATLKQRDRYLVLRRALRRGDVVRADDLIEQEMDQQRPMAGYLMADQADRIVGYAAVRALPSDRLLQAGWFAVPQAIERGHRVRVLVQSGPMVIESIGLAMGNGRIGDSIEVQNTKSQRRFMAKVSGPSEVVVQF